MSKFKNTLVLVSLISAVFILIPTTVIKAQTPTTSGTYCKQAYASNPGIVMCDGFETGDYSATNAEGFKWIDNAWTSIVSRTEETADAHGRITPPHNKVNADAFPGGDWTPHSGNYSMRFRYRAGKAWSEQRFKLGAPIKDIWVSFWARVPLNYSHKHPDGNNRKFFSLWMDGYSVSNSGPTVIWEFRGIGSDRSDLDFHYLESGPVGDTTHRQGTPFIHYPSDRGRWMNIVLHAKAATDSTSRDGIIQTWQRWENQSTFTKLHDFRKANIYPFPGGVQGWKGGFILGWANAAYTENTEWLIDDFVVSTTPLLNTASNAVSNKDTTAPAQPTSFKATPTQTSVSLTWGASTDNVAVAGYKVYRNGTQITTTTGTSYTNTGLTAGTTYTYTVIAYDSAGNNSAGDTITATTAKTTSGTNNPKVTTCSSFNYSAWGTCQSNGIQTRSVSSSIPAGCVNGTPVVTQSCTYTAPASNSGGGGGYFIPSVNRSYKDIIPPGHVTNVERLYKDNQVTLKWRNPSDSDYNGTLVVRKVGSRPTSHTDGTIVYKSTTLYKGANEEYTDTNIDNNTTYYYAIYAYDKQPNYSIPMYVQVRLQTNNDTATAVHTTPKTTEQVVQQTTKPTVVLPQLSGTFRIGMRNNKVKLLQEYLAKDKEVYPQGITSGYYGPLTRSAVERFQRKYNIVSSGSPYTTGYGLAGPATRAKMQEVLSGVHTSASTQQADQAKKILIASIQTKIDKLQKMLVTLLSQLAQMLKEQVGK